VTYCFADFELDASMFELRRSGRRVRVEPKVLDLLLCLLRARDRLVSRQELIETLWPDVKVSEASVWRAVLEARRALGDDLQQTIVTVRGRGFRFAVPVVEKAASALPSPSTLPAEDEDDGSLVGREAARAAVDARLGRACAGQGGAVWLSGEAGIGKTRLAEDAMRRATTRGALVLSAGAHAAPGTPPYWLWAEVLRAHQRAGEGEPSAESLAGLAPILAGVDVQTDAERFKLFEAIFRYFGEASRDRTLVIVFEDLQWADEASLQLLEPFVREIRRHALLVVGTYRDTAPRDFRSSILGGLLGQSGSVHVPLRGLALDDVARLIDMSTGVPPSQAFVRAVFERSGGNPLYVKEVLKTEWADRAITAEASDVASTMDLEQGIIESVFRHLDGLSPHARDLLTLAAVLGKEFPMGHLGLVSGLHRDELMDRVDEACRANLLYQSDGHCIFNHVLVRDVLYKRLASAERSARHLMVAEKLQSHYDDVSDTHAAQLAEHFTRALPAGDAERAIEMAMRAARHATAFGRPREAAKHWKQAARVYPLLAREDRRRVEIQMSLARAWLAAGRLPEARECFVDGAILARTFSQPEDLAEAALSYAALSGNEKSLRQALLEQARAALAESAEARLRDLRARVETALAERAR
jgi:predicted ATPase/DNA-binding winged helix-turn-helix (wHTH) protein